MKPQDKEQHSPLEILYEDNHLIAVYKPANLVTQKTESSLESLEERVKLSIKERYKKSGAIYLHAVHRIDKATSGIVLFAKTSKALSRLNEMIREKKVKKQYIALCEGTFSNEEGTLSHFLIHGDFEAKVVDKDHPEGKKAELSYKVLSQKNEVARVAIDLTTGRYHQIRAQFAAIGHPILGDKKYGSTRASPFSKDEIALHHYKMSFVHPVTKEEVVITKECPF